MHSKSYGRLARWGLIVSGSLFFLGGCDTQTRTAIENGIVTSSTSLFGAALQALINLQLEKATSSTSSTAASRVTPPVPVEIFT